MTLRWGFVGTGNIAGTLAQALARTTGGTLAAVASRDAGRAAAFAAEHGAARSYGGEDAVRRMLEDGIDALYVATTHPHHHAPARLALEAGTAVLVEKPMTVSLAATLDLVQLAQKKTTFLMEAYWTRLLPGTAALLEVVASGQIGEVQSLHADFGFAFGADATRFHDAASGGGSLLDLGPYPVGLAVLLFGAAQQVRAVGSLTPNGVDRHVSIAARFTGGAVASLSTTMVAHAANRAWIEGTRGNIEIDPILPRPESFTVRSTPAEGPASGRAGGQAGGEVVETRHEHRVEHGHRYMFDHVHECLRAGLTQSPLVSHQWSIDVAHLMEEALTQVGVARNLESLGPEAILRTSGAR